MHMDNNNNNSLEVEKLTKCPAEIYRRFWLKTYRMMNMVFWEVQGQSWLIQGQHSQPDGLSQKEKWGKKGPWLILVSKLHLTQFLEARSVTSLLQSLSIFCSPASLPCCFCNSSPVHTLFQHSQLLSNQELTCHLWPIFTLLQRLSHRGPRDIRYYKAELDLYIP